MIDRIVHAEVITFKGSFHRLRNTRIDTLPSARDEHYVTLETVNPSHVNRAQFSSVTDNLVSETPRSDLTRFNRWT